MNYAHEELMEELGITKADLPKDLSVRIGAWSNKKRLSNSAVKIEEVRIKSEDLADDITAWHYAMNEEEEEEEEDNHTPPVVVTPPVVPVSEPVPPVAPVVTPPVEPIITPPVATPPTPPVDPEPEKESGWGLGFLNW